MNIDQKFNQHHMHLFNQHIQYQKGCYNICCAYDDDDDDDMHSICCNNFSDLGFRIDNKLNKTI